MRRQNKYAAQEVFPINAVAVHGRRAHTHVLRSFFPSARACQPAVRQPALPCIHGATAARARASVRIPQLLPWWQVRLLRARLWVLHLSRRRQHTSHLHERLQHKIISVAIINAGHGRHYRAGRCYHAAAHDYHHHHVRTGGEPRRINTRRWNL